jgi:hypothetical protein
LFFVGKNENSSENQAAQDDVVYLEKEAGSPARRHCVDVELGRLHSDPRRHALKDVLQFSCVPVGVTGRGEVERGDEEGKGEEG